MPPTDRPKTQAEINDEFTDYMMKILGRFDRVATRLELLAGIEPGSTGEEDSRRDPGAPVNPSDAPHAPASAER